MKNYTYISSCGTEFDVRLEGLSRMAVDSGCSGYSVRAENLKTGEASETTILLCRAAVAELPESTRRSFALCADRSFQQTKQWQAIIEPHVIRTVETLLDQRSSLGGGEEKITGGQLNKLIDDYRFKPRSCAFRTGADGCFMCDRKNKETTKRECDNCGMPDERFICNDFRPGPRGYTCTSGHDICSGCFFKNDETAHCFKTRVVVSKNS